MKPPKYQTPVPTGVGRRVDPQKATPQRANEEGFRLGPRKDSHG